MEICLGNKESHGWTSNLGLMKSEIWWGSSDEGHQLCPATHSDVKVVQKIKGNFVIS